MSVQLWREQNPRDMVAVELPVSVEVKKRASTVFLWMEATRIIGELAAAERAQDFHQN